MDLETRISRLEQRRGIDHRASTERLLRRKLTNAEWQDIQQARRALPPTPTGLTRQELSARAKAVLLEGLAV